MTVQGAGTGSSVCPDIDAGAVPQSVRTGTGKHPPLPADTAAADAAEGRKEK